MNKRFEHLFSFITEYHGVCSLSCFLNTHKMILKERFYHGWSYSVFLNLCRGWREGAGHTTVDTQGESLSARLALKRLSLLWDARHGAPRPCLTLVLVQQPSGTLGVHNAAPHQPECCLAILVTGRQRLNPTKISWSSSLEFSAALRLNHFLFFEKHFPFDFKTPYSPASLPYSLANP